jgi:DNA-binding NarL/FixJ family response regulator
MSLDTKKKIILFDTCTYTTCGLTLLCECYPEWEITAITRTSKQLIAQLVQSRTDMVICGIGNQSGDISKMLHIPDYPLGRSILLINKESSILYNTFMAAGFDAVFSKNLPLTVFTDTLSDVLDEAYHTEKTKKQSLIYLPQERYILSALLKGERQHDIATTLNMTYRTVSRYKQSALKRAGLTKLNEILSCQKEYLDGCDEAHLPHSK